MLFAPGLLAPMFGVPLPEPRIFADLNGLFLLVIGAGYYFPWREPERYRGYMWMMGPVLKGAGATLFVLDYVYRGSPASFLISRSMPSMAWPTGTPASPNAGMRCSLMPERRGWGASSTSRPASASGTR